MIVLSLLLTAAPFVTASFQGYCNSAPQSGWPICDSAQSIEVRTADITSRVSLADKIQMLSAGQYPAGQGDNQANRGTPLPSVGMDVYNWWSEITHGLMFANFTPTFPASSNTALPITTSCSFNRTLWSLTGNQLGRESRAFMNAGLAFSTFWGM